jgi:hypothetical protein
MVVDDVVSVDQIQILTCVTSFDADEESKLYYFPLCRVHLVLY